MRLVNEEIIIDLYTNIYVCSKVKCNPLNVKCRKSSGSTYFCNGWSYTTHYTPTIPIHTPSLYIENTLEDVKTINDTDNNQLGERNREEEPVPMILKYENEKGK